MSALFAAYQTAAPYMGVTVNIYLESDVTHYVIRDDVANYFKESDNGDYLDFRNPEFTLNIL